MPSGAKLGNLFSTCLQSASDFNHVAGHKYKKSVEIQECYGAPLNYGQEEKNNDGTRCTHRFMGNIVYCKDFMLNL